MIRIVGIRFVFLKAIQFFSMMSKKSNLMGFDFFLNSVLKPVPRRSIRNGFGAFHQSFSAFFQSTQVVVMVDVRHCGPQVIYC